MPARLRTLPKGVRLRANEKDLVALSSKIRANVLKRELLRRFSDCVVDPMAAILAFARLSKIDWETHDCVRCHLYKVADAAIISVPKWQTKCMKRGLRSDALPGVTHAEAVCYVKEFCGACMSREFTKVV